MADIPTRALAGANAGSARLGNEMRPIIDGIDYGRISRLVNPLASPFEGPSKPKPVCTAQHL